MERENERVVVEFVEALISCVVVANQNVVEAERLGDIAIEASVRAGENLIIEVVLDQNNNIARDNVLQLPNIHINVDTEETEAMEDNELDNVSYASAEGNGSLAEQDSSSEGGSLRLLDLSSEGGSLPSLDLSSDSEPEADAFEISSPQPNAALAVAEPAVRRSRRILWVQYLCNLCFTYARCAVITICGHLYCWNCLWPYLSNAREPCCLRCHRPLIFHEDLIRFTGEGPFAADADNDTLALPGDVPRPSGFYFTDTNIPFWFVVNNNEIRFVPPNIKRRNILKVLRDLRTKRPGLSRFLRYLQVFQALLAIFMILLLLMITYM